MSTSSSAVILTPDLSSLPGALSGWLRDVGLVVEQSETMDAVMARCLRGRPRLVVIDVRGGFADPSTTCARIKKDSYSAVVPSVVVCEPGDGAMERCFAAGADEVLTEATPVLEVRSRLNAALARSDRDVQVHPSTRLPGTETIERAIGAWMASGARFGVCYADLDHFKEFNDRYGYHEGDRVIRVLAGILHDVVKGMCGEEGFVGHIGGDDFIFIIPSAMVQSVCTEVIEVFDLLGPLQYSEADRRAGYFFGKDRRGLLHRVPLMTLSIGVVTNERRTLTSVSHVSELATEMKAYAKSHSGSVFFVDRRAEPVTPDVPRAGLPTPPGLRFR